MTTIFSKIGWCLYLLQQTDRCPEAAMNVDGMLSWSWSLLISQLEWCPNERSIEDTASTHGTTFGYVSVPCNRCGCWPALENAVAMGKYVDRSVQEVVCRSTQSKHYAKTYASAHSPLPWRDKRLRTWIPFITLADVAAGMHALCGTCFMFGHVVLNNRHGRLQRWCPDVLTTPYFCMCSP